MPKAKQSIKHSGPISLIFPSLVIQPVIISRFSNIHDWIKCNKLSLYTIKSTGTSRNIKYQDLEPKTTPFMVTTSESIKIKGVKLTKYLGLWVDDNLTWEVHFFIIFAPGDIYSKMACNIGIIKQIKNFIKKESLLTLYRILVEPYH